jgi:hypothetical protein
MPLHGHSYYLQSLEDDHLQTGYHHPKIEDVRPQTHLDCTLVEKTTEGAQWVVATQQAVVVPLSEDAQQQAELPQ